MRRLETVRTQEEGWQEPCESGGSRTDLWERGGEIPLRYPTHHSTEHLLLFKFCLFAALLIEHLTFEFISKY